jgi:hypothetical protein
MTGDSSPHVGTETVIPGSNEENYEKRLLILRPESLKEEYRHAEFQYFLANAGFGCDPSKLGTKVFGEFLCDGEKAAFRRYDFLGIADENKLPEWAKQKLQNMAGQESGTQNTHDISM